MSGAAVKPASAIVRSGQAEPCRPWPRHVLARDAWAAMARALADEPGLALLALWADTAHVHALLLDEAEDSPPGGALLPGGSLLPVSTPVIEGGFAALSPHRPGAAWYERMVHDLWGHAATGGRDLRPWLDHGRWGQTRPMSVRPLPGGGAPEPPAFLPAEGEDLHQVAVGPIHAGIIEPGHFRFTAQGETIVRLEARLGYAHKGTLALMRGKPPRQAARFAARLSGDSTVAHAIAFARAVEAATAVAVPPRAHALRAVMGELERIANHLGDAGAICNDASFAFPLARFGFHREAVLRASAVAFGHRLMMDCVVPGGVVAEIAPGGAASILRALAAVEAELPDLARVYADYASLADRVIGTGVVSAALARRFAAGGYVGRAAGRGFDARRWPGYPPYDALPPRVPVLQEGDVDARVRIRLAEIAESVRLLRLLLDAGPPEKGLVEGGGVLAPVPPLSGEGIGVAEGFRGDIWHWLRLDGGLLSAAFARDPSWAHWPLLEAAARRDIVADFPLTNKSFNASYSGVDL